MATDPVDWDVARKVARRVAGREPFRATHLREELQADFARFTAQAEDLVADCTGLRSLSGDARGRVTTRAGWIDANVASFGMMLGWMSTRVLGQYDLLVIEEENPDDQDIVYYVAPNVLALERRYAFPPQEFRLWLALHEVTHRAQFTGVPWMREHFLGLVESTMDSVDPDPQRVLAAIQRLIEARRRGEDPLDQGGIMALFASEEQLVVIQQVAGLMSLLEGHGDVTMDRAGAGLVPSAERFSRVLRQRRQSASGFTKVFQRLAGLEAKLKQYAEGERFIGRVEEHGGPEMLDRAWSAPENLPSIEEIRDPDLWIARVGSDRPAAA